jgi:ATP-dependent DNA helicase PIF1
MIGHKSQGTTITTKVFIDIKDAFSLGLTYVMFSRITNQANLKIVGTLTPNDFALCNFDDE